MGVGAGLCMYDVVVKKVHVRYLISWWVFCLSLYKGIFHWSWAWTNSLATLHRETWTFLDRTSCSLALFHLISLACSTSRGFRFVKF